MTKLGEHQRAAYIGRVFQDPMTGTAATMQIEENLALAARRGKRRGLRIGITKAERERYRELLKSLDLGLENRLTARASENTITSFPIATPSMAEVGFFERILFSFPFRNSR